MTTVRFSPEAIRAARLAEGISQREASERVGVTPSTVKNIESGRHEPRVELAARLAAVYGVRIESLFVHEPNAATAAALRAENDEAA